MDAAGGGKREEEQFLKFPLEKPRDKETALEKLICIGSSFILLVLLHYSISWLQESVLLSEE